mmetsp:Transcript_9113/g.11269  ORF Transcript_9113/g.11269 Transcript_9113/m.11269 type:complete len:195 (-) Transcript_9113:50-634(-)
MTRNLLLIFVFVVAALGSKGGPLFLEPSNTIYNNGIAGAEYPGKICSGGDWYNDCTPTTNHEIFYCFNYRLNVPVPCSNRTWDPMVNACGIAEVRTPNCTTKDCVDHVREFYEGSNVVYDSIGRWQCVNNRGYGKMCGDWESHAGDVLYFVFSVSSSSFERLFPSYPNRLAKQQCNQAYKAWKDKPESMAFSLF